MSLIASSRTDAPKENTVKETDSPHKSKITQVIAEFREKIQSAAKAHLQNVEHTILESSIIETFLRAIQSNHEQLQPNTTNSILSQILTNTQEIQQRLKADVQIKQNTTTPKSWSQVAVAPYEGPQADAAISGQLRPQEARKAKEIVVTIENEEEREKTRHIDTETLVNMIIGKDPKGPTKEILAARKLPSGDVQFVVRTENAKQTLENDNEWAQKIATSAKVKKHTFLVIAHGMRVAGIDTSKQSQAITKIHEQNRRLHTEMEITRATWNKGTIQKGKRFGSLILATPSIKMANAIISQGLLFEGELKTCERFTPNARIQQCFRCQEYRHYSINCKKSQACGYCSQEHATKECPQKETGRRRCALCKENHATWDGKCRYRQKELERTRVIRAACPTYYSQITRKTKADSNGQLRAVTPSDDQPLNSISSTQFTFDSSLEAQQRSAKEWKTVVKSRRGRPNGIFQAANDPFQTKLHTALQTVIPEKRCRDEVSPSTAHDHSQEPKKTRNHEEETNEMEC